ncbi:MAG: tetratricopeptide repeat protein [Alphaproteobacteria bacterium]
MLDDESATNGYEQVLSVDEVEDLLKESPDDLMVKEDLAAALVDRLVYGDDNVGPGSEHDVERLREILACLSSDKAVYARAYVAYLDSKDTEAVRWIVKYARGGDEENVSESFSSDELYLDVIVPFSDVTQEFWSELAVGLAELWPDTPAALVVAGHVNQDENKVAEAFDCYDRALQKNPDYWMAAWGLAEVHYSKKEWQAAAHYYESALQSELAREIPSLNFQAAYTYGALKKHASAESYYRKCLENDPEFPSARNNLGWSLYRQGRFEEALAVFDECLALRTDGVHAQENKARALTRLGRVGEALEAWKQTRRDGEFSQDAQKQIARLQAKINQGESGDAGFWAEEEDEEDDESGTSQEI